MNRVRTTMTVALLAGAAVATAAPASAAAPSPNASCVGRTFAPQTEVYGPGAIAHRIAEIKGFIDVSFGAVIGDFARWTDCSG